MKTATGFTTAILLCVTIPAQTGSANTDSIWVAMGQTQGIGVMTLKIKNRAQLWQEYLL